MASFSEWSNNKKKQTGGTAQNSAQSFSTWSNQKLGKEEPVMLQSYRNQNTAFERSGLSRDEYDSGVRESYAQRVAQENRRTTSGGFYSQPTFGEDTERLQTRATTAQTRLESKQKELEEAAAVVSEAERGMSFVESHMNQLYSSYQNNPTQQAADLFNKAYGMYETRLGEYNTAVDSFNSLYAEYEPLLSEYNTAAGAYNDYITQQQKAYSDWKGTIRSAEDIQADIAAQDSQIAALQQQQKDLNAEAARLMNMVSSRRGGTQQLMEWSQQAAALRGQADGLDDDIATLEEMKTLLGEELEWADYFRYADLTQNEDFAELSKYVSTETGEEPVFNAWSGMYTDTGFADVNYDIINRNETAKSRQGVTNISTNASFLGLDNSERGQMTDEEIAIFNYLYAQDAARGDTEHSTAYGYIDYLTSDLNYRQRQADEAQWAAYAAESPVGSSIFSILESPLKGLSYIGQIADYAEDGEIDQNAGYNKFSYLNSAIREEVSGIVEENWGGVGTFAYQTGMSMGDFLFNTAISGGNQAVALAIMGSGAAADGTIRAKDRGLTDDQAFALGTIAGAAEIITEKLSLDALLDATKLGKSAFGYFVQNTVVEGTEEVGADFINLFADIMIAKDKSEWQQSIDAYMAQGCDEDTAFWNAFTDQAINMGLDFLGGAISGATFAGAAIGGNQVVTALDNRRQQRQQTAEQMQQRAAELQPQEEMEGIVLPTAEEAMGNIPAQQNTQQPIQQEAAQQTTVQQQAPAQMQEPGMLPTAEQAELQSERRRAMAAATTELERSGIEAGVATETIEQAQRISQAIGRDIVFYNEAATASGIRNGYYSPADGKIHVNSQSRNPLAQIIAHEMTHSVELAESYGELSDIVLRRIQQTSDLQQLRQQKTELYARNGVELQSETEIDQEIVAEYVERYLLTDERSIMELSRENRTLGERILRWINGLLAKLGNTGAQERAFLTQARDAYAKALSQTSFTEQTAASTPQANAEAQNQGDTEAALRALREAYANGEITEEEFDAALDVIMEEEGMADQTMLEKNSFGGVNANGANLETLRQAQEMERQGVAAETIFRQTGWYTGADGKWRFEMDDSQMEYHPGGDAQFSQNHPEYAEHQSLMQKLFNGDITDAEHDRLIALDEIWGREFGRLSERVERGNATLGDILQHDELFRNYPQLRKTRVRFEQMEPGTRGSYDPSSDTITLNSEMNFNTEATLIHEVQHAIQKAEGFARGSSTEYWNQPRVAAIKPEHRAEIEAAQEEVERWEQRFVDEWGEGSVNLTLAQRYVELIEQLGEPGDSTAILQELENIDEMVEESGWDDLLTGYAGARAELSLKKAAALRNRFDSYTAYRNTAGEIEARDVAERRTLTAEQRRERMPDTGDENTLFVEADEDSYAMSQSEQDSLKEQLREYQDRLNTMKAVATISDNGWRGMNTGAFRQKIVNDLKKTGYRVDNPDIGVIEFDEKLLNRSLNYIQTDAEAAAYQAIPQVLKRGIPLSGHEDHKGRGYETVTIAAPVELNGKRGNMAVVVMKTKGNRYKVHRILTPEGKAFELPEMANAESTTAGGIAEAAKATGAVTPTIDSASTDSITENGLPVKEQFSISEPVEQTKDLLAVHNKDWSIIRDAVLNWGGIPSPSIAIVEAQQGHTAYGDTSVIYPRSTIDPQADSRNKVYGGDAWTPTHSDARIEYEVDYDVKREFQQNIELLARDVAGGIFAQSSVLDMVGVEDQTEMSLQDIAKKLADRYDSVRAAYLADKGGDIEIVYRTKEFDSFGNDALRSFIDKVGEQETARLAAKMLTGERLNESEIEMAKDAIIEHWTAKNEWRLKQKPELRDKRIAKQREKLSDLRAEDFVRNAWDFYEDSGATTDEVDRMATAENLRHAVDAKAVEEWTLEMLGGLLGEPGIYNGTELLDARGNRKSFRETHWEYTAENIVRAMNNAKDRGQGMWGISGEGLVAMATPNYGSVEDIHADEARLQTVDEGEYKALMQELNEELERVTADIMGTTEHHASNSFEEEQIIGEVIAMAAQGKRTTAAVKQAFRKEGYAITDKQAQSILTLLEHAGSVPAGYFEAKPQRVVGFEEALAVIAPDYIPAEELAAVRNAGVNVIEYSTDAQRVEIANSLEGAKFSISEEYNRTAILQESTIDKYLQDYAAKSSPRYAQAYIAYMTPEEFLELTTSVEGRVRIERESTELDRDGFAESTLHQPLQLNIDHETGAVEGHEGRHRVTALRDAGIERVPVLLFDSSNKYSKEAIDLLTLYGQDFGSTKSYATVDVVDVQPLSYENRDTIIRKFGTQPHNEQLRSKYDGRQTLRYSVSEQQDKQEIIQNLRGILNRGGNAAELRRYVDTLEGERADLPAYNDTEAAELVRTAHNEGLSVDEYLRQNWESYEYDGQLNETARRALELEKRQGRRRYSVSERVFTTPRGVEVVQNPTDSEYRQMREEAYQEYPWLRGTGEPMLRHTYDEAGNEYYWRADQAMHAQVEPYINEHYGTRTSQQWQWWTREDKDDYPTDYSRRYSIDEEETDITSTLPQKAQQYLRRTERYLLDKVSALLSVPRYAQREFLQDIVRDISTEYLQTGTVSQQTIDDLFERAYDEGIEVDSEYYDTYKHIKDYLRTQAITLSEQDKSNIADWGDFRKSTFGTLRIVNDGGIPVDVAYMELQGMAQELFPEDITHPADQLMRMFDVGRSIQRVEKSLDEVYGYEAEEFKRWAKNDFDAAVNDVLSELRQVKRFADERAQQDEAEIELTQEQVAAMYGQLKEARRTYEKAAAKNLLTQHDEIQVGRLLRGEIELEHLDPAKDNVKGITAVYEAKQEYERLTRSIREWNQSRKAKLRETADGLLETANDWKDKKAGILYSRETMERNIRDIVKDSTLAEKIIAEYFKPVHDAQAEATRMKNKYRERVLALNLSRKVAKGNTVSEAHAVQLLGEAEDCIRMLEQSKGRMKMRDGKTLSDWRGIVSELWSENPKLDKAKIEAAVKEFRSIYDELFQQMNESRVRNGYEPVNYRSGYFPHFQPGDNDGILGQFGKALGIDMDVSALPTTINGLTHTFKPGIQWFGNAQERLGFNTAYDAVEGFDRYIEGVADVVHQTDNIQKLRALATQTRYRTGDEGIRKQVDAVLADTTLSETDKQNRIEKIYETGRYALSNFVVELEEYTNLLANKKSRADRNMEQALGRRMYELVKKLESRVAANMVAINPASWLTNFIPLTQGGALLDRGMLLHGMWDTLKAYKTSDGIVDKSTFLTNRRGSDPIVKTWAQAASAKMSSPMEYIDNFTADSLVRARYRQNLNKGLSEDAAMSEADSWVAGVMADRSKGSTPTLFNRSNPVTKVFTQFQLEVNNQLGYLFKDMPRDAREKGLKALAAALIKFLMGAYLYNEVYEYVIGRRPALDPLGILNDTVGDITGYELPNLVELGVGAISGDLPSFEVEKKNAYETAEGLATAVAEELPFIGGILGGGRVPISSALPDWENLGKAALNDEWSAEKRLATGLKELGNPATYLALPFGGGQIKKIYQGIKAVIEGGSYSVDSAGNDILQYPVYRDGTGETILNTAGAVLFGKSSLPTGRDWVESGFKSLGATETACYQAMLDAGIGGEEAFGLLQELRGAKKTDTQSESTVERGILKDSDISGEGKSIVYYGLMASDKERELMDALADDADMGEVTSVLMEIKDAGNLTGAAASNGKREAIMDAVLTDDEKKLVYRYMMGTKQEDGSYTSSRDDDIMAFEQAGMDFDQFLQAQNEYSTINEEYDSSGEKAMEFSRWVNSQMLTAEQADTMRDCFKYYSQIPQEAARYNDFVAAGLDDDAAYELANTLNGLEPLEGEDTVSNLQRYRAVVDAGLTEDEQMTVLSELMTESEYGKMQTGYSFGVTPAAYVAYKELLPQYDADGNGSFKQEEVEAAIDAMGTSTGIMLPSAGAPSAGSVSLTNAEKAALWQMANKSWKPKNNPYDTYVGQQVYDALNAEPATGGLQLPSQSEEESGIQLPTAGSSLKLPSQG